MSFCSKYSSFNSANRDERACCRRFRGVIGVTDSDSVGDVSMRSYLSPDWKGGQQQEERERERLRGVELVKQKLGELRSIPQRISNND